MLSLVSTPIGNLQDITYRALDTLKSSDYILCEDTRHSLKLLTHFGIQKPLYSLHQHNELFKIDQIIEDLEAGKHIALVSDAGTPSICDPSAFLVKKCHEKGIKVVAACGPSSLTSALSLYGMIRPNFQFLGFAPKESKSIQSFLNQALFYDGTTVFFDTPHQIERTLHALNEKAPRTPLTIIKELSKIYENISTNLPQTWLSLFKQTPIKGELVCIIEGEKKESETISEEHVMTILKKELNLPYNELIKLACKLLNQPKNALYDRWLNRN